MEPTRARPVPFCFQSFLPEPLTSHLSLVLAVPERRLARKWRTASQIRCSFTSSSLKTSGSSSTVPTCLLSRLTTGCWNAAILGLLLDDDVPTLGAGDGALDEQQVVLGVHLGDLQVAHGHLGVAHVAGHAHAGEDAAGVARLADGAGSAVEHGAVGRTAARKVVPLDDAGEALALADAGDVHLGLRLEGAGQDAVAGLGGVGGVHLDLAEHADRGDTQLLAVALLGLGGALAAVGVHEADLAGLVAMLGGGLALHDHAGAGLDDRHGDDLALLIEDLGPPQLLADDSFGHVFSPLYLLP